MRRYRNRVSQCPLRLPHNGGPHQFESEQIFEELKACIEKKSTRTSERNQWISAGTWALVDHRARLRSQGSLQQRAGRQLSRRISQSFQRDREARALKAGEQIEALLAEGNVQEAWGMAKRWYRKASDRGPKPCMQTMVRQTQERVELYRKRDSPGDPIPINVDPYEVEDGIPEDAEIRQMVKDKLKRGRVGGVAQIRAEDIKQWLRGAELED